MEPTKKIFNFDIPELDLGDAAPEAPALAGAGQAQVAVIRDEDAPPIIHRVAASCARVLTFAESSSEEEACSSLLSRDVKIKDDNKRTAGLADIEDLTDLMEDSAEISSYYEKGHEVPPPPVRGYRIVRQNDGLFYLVKKEDVEEEAPTARVFKRLRMGN